MAVVQINSFIINNVTSTDAVIEAGINITSTVFSVSVVPISNTQSRVIMMYN